MEETLSSTNTSTKQQWIAEQAEKHPERVFTSLHHLIDALSANITETPAPLGITVGRGGEYQ